MILVAGLGNPGKKYQKTRHNLGFMVLDRLAELLKADFKEEKKFKAELAKVMEGPDGVILAKPLTYMNNSGEAVKKIIDYFNIYEGEVWVVHDDLDIEIGKIRIRKGGSSAGQKGIESVIRHLSTEEFIRFRLGICPKRETKMKAEDFVLGRFTKGEEAILSEVIEATAETIKESIISGQPLEITTI